MRRLPQARWAPDRSWWFLAALAALAALGLAVFFLSRPAWRAARDWRAGRFVAAAEAAMATTLMQYLTVKPFRFQ